MKICSVPVPTGDGQCHYYYLGKKKKASSVQSANRWRLGIMNKTEIKIVNKYYVSIYLKDSKRKADISLPQLAG